jgi:transcriptional regulator with XRE-family HTH domain
MPKSKHVDEEIGALIAAARKRQKMTREVTAEKIGISYPMLQRHERGLSPISVSRLLQLAEVLGVLRFAVQTQDVNTGTMRANDTVLPTDAFENCASFVLGQPADVDKRHVV